MSSPVSAYSINQNTRHGNRIVRVQQWTLWTGNDKVLAKSLKQPCTHRLDLPLGHGKALLVPGVRLDVCGLPRRLQVQGSTLKYRAVHWSTGQYTEVQGSMLKYRSVHWSTGKYTKVHGNTLKYRLVHWNTWQYTEVHGSTLKYKAVHWNTGQYTEIQGSTLKYRSLF